MQGARGVDGLWYGHYWVDAQIEGEGDFVVDITADQFGHPPVMVIPGLDAVTIYRPGRQDLVDAAAEELAGELSCRDLIGLAR